MVSVCFIFQTSLFGFFHIFGTIPNVSLILVVIFAMMTDGITGGIIGIITGFLYDAMLYDVFGVYTLVYFLIGAVIGTYSDSMMRENYTAYCTVTLVATIARQLLLYLVLYFLKYNLGNVAFIFKGIFVETALNTVLVIFVLKLTVFIFNKLNMK
jgi:rod shape-determining protein MreD